MILRVPIFAFVSVNLHVLGSNSIAVTTFPSPLIKEGKGSVTEFSLSNDTWPASSIPIVGTLKLSPKLGFWSVLIPLVLSSFASPAAACDNTNELFSGYAFTFNHLFPVSNVNISFALVAVKVLSCPGIKAVLVEPVFFTFNVLKL